MFFEGDRIAAVREMILVRRRKRAAAWRHSAKTAADAAQAISLDLFTDHEPACR
jgi:hypothetical protein